MGQLLLPIFPIDTRMITLTLGVREYDGTVYYLHSGVPIFSHLSDDLTKFRYITSNLILQGLCNNQDIADTFHVSTDSVRRWKKKLSEEGDVAFFLRRSHVMAEVINYCPLYWIAYRGNLIKGKVPIPSPKRKRYQKAASGMPLGLGD
jgi:hypothetical protein